MVSGAPGQPKRLGTDAFTASGALDAIGFGWWCFGSLAAKSSEGVRSRQKLCDGSRSDEGFWDDELPLLTREGSLVFPEGVVVATGSEILESHEERIARFDHVHSLNASVRGSGSNCLVCASGRGWVMSNSG